MPATASAFGLRPVRGVGSASYTGGATEYPVDAASTRMAVGDPVILTAAGTVTRAVTPASDIYIGAVIGFRTVDRGANPTLIPFSQVYVAGTTGIIAQVVDNPNAEFAIQTSATLAAADLGLNADITATVVGANATISPIALNAGSAAVTNTLGWKIVGLVESADNNWGDSFVNVRVRCNRHRLVNQLAGI